MTTPPGGTVLREAVLNAGPAGARRPSRQLAFNAAAGGMANAVKIVIQLIMLPLMAHLLGPAEFGLYALALPTVSLFSSLADGGLGTSLAREGDDDPVVWSTAFWVVLGLGVVLTALVSSWGAILSVLSHEPRLAGLMGFLSLSLFLISTSILPSARLTRQGRLGIFAGADVVSTTIGAVVAVVLAARGEGAWSLAVQYVTGFLIRAIILNGVAFARPTLQFRLSSLRGHLSTGSAMLGSRLAEFAGRLLENLFYQRIFGASGLGTYTFANQAPRFICEAASNPLWAALYAHALHESPERVAALHKRLVHLLAAVVFPVAFLLSASAHTVLALLLGPKWSATADLLQVLVPFYALYVVASQSGAILVANGRSWTLFWCMAGLAAGRDLAVLAGYVVSPVAVAFLIGGCYVIFTTVMVRAPARFGGTHPGAVLTSVATAVGASVAAGVLCHLVLAPHAGEAGWLVVSLAAGTLLYAVLMILFDGRRLRGELSAVRALVRRRGTPP